MKISIKTDLVSGIMCFILSIALWILIPSQIKLGPKEDPLVNSQFMPKLIVVVMLVCSILLIIQSFRKQKNVVKVDLKKELKALLYIALLIIYIVLLNVVGFLIMSMVVGVLTLIILKCKKWHYYAITLSLVVFLQIVFTKVMNIPLP